MSIELDRRIAIEVMGEPQPEIPWVLFREKPLPMQGSKSSFGNWCLHYDHEDAEWQPLPFSTDYEHCMRAVEEYLDGIRAKNPDHELAHLLETQRYWGYWGGSHSTEPYVARFLSPVRSQRGRGKTLPEAICNLLLALVEKEGA